ncbi:MAG: hypothetical protein KGZ39_04985 [Simkania sp.]|nr:hypothetical protein [Simkania sp.]
MHELTDKQLYEAIHYARSHDEQAGKAILERFQVNQAAFAQTIFSVFPSVIADLDQSMAHLFMDLCFDVIAVYEHAFGKVADQRIVGNQWFEEKARQYDQALNEPIGQAKPNDSTYDTEEEHQKKLVNFLHAAIDQQPCDSVAAVRLAKTMIFTAVQLFDALYDATVEHQNQSIH